MVRAAAQTRGRRGDNTLATKLNLKAGGVSPGIIAGVVVVLIAFIAWLGYINLVPHTEPPEVKTTPEGAANNAWITQKAKESGGDISRLSADDQAKLQKITRGFGAVALKTMLQPSK